MRRRTLRQWRVPHAAGHVVVARFATAPAGTTIPALVARDTPTTLNAAGSAAISVAAAGARLDYDFPKQATMNVSLDVFLARLSAIGVDFSRGSFTAKDRGGFRIDAPNVASVRAVEDLVRNTITGVDVRPTITYFPRDWARTQSAAYVAALDSALAQAERRAVERHVALDHLLAVQTAKTRGGYLDKSGLFEIDESIVLTYRVR